MSGLKEEYKLFFLLKIENKFSKQGYHNNKTIKKGDINKF